MGQPTLPSIIPAIAAGPLAGARPQPVEQLLQGEAEPGDTGATAG